MKDKKNTSECCIANERTSLNPSNDLMAWAFSFDPSMSKVIESRTGIMQAISFAIFSKEIWCTGSPI